LKNDSACVDGLNFVPEGRRILAGDEITGSPSICIASPGGAMDKSRPAPLRGWPNYDAAFPVISSPANIRCASGTKTFASYIQISFGNSL
jgi:hypothetical protein